MTLMLSNYERYFMVNSIIKTKIQQSTGTCDFTYLANNA
ncbi:MAG: hypothetical protein QG641_1524 [Candidatus Poribacteria bacterium]|nr:hypothetical protein [Candidatus Poribacteria bacterium]